MDSFVDGALSLENHVDQYEYKVRNVIRDAINDYLKAKLPGIDAHPPMPRYGCYVRSGIVKKFPDLIVTVLAVEDITAAMLVRHSILDEGIMLCLFSEVPNKSNFTGLGAGGISAERARLCSAYRVPGREKQLEPVEPRAVYRPR
ncbi:hypothetical protein V8C35DRAFT_263473 [Trichoderma chlorosporum]